MYKEIPHFDVFLFVFPVFPVFWACCRETEWGRNVARSGKKRRAGKLQMGQLVLLLCARESMDFRRSCLCSRLEGVGTCPAADEKCQRENIKKEQKVKIPVPYTRGICPDRWCAGSGMFFRAGHSLVFVVGVAAAGTVGGIPLCPLQHSALRKKCFTPPLQRCMIGSEIHCALSRAGR